MPFCLLYKKYTTYEKVKPDPHTIQQTRALKGSNMTKKDAFINAEQVVMHVFLSVCVYTYSHLKNFLSLCQPTAFAPQNFFYKHKFFLYYKHRCYSAFALCYYYHHHFYNLLLLFYYSNHSIVKCL